MREDIREFSIKDISRVRNIPVVVIGGGTGLSSILRGIKKYTNDLTAIVTMGDDGGSSGRLREELGLLPPGDIRNCILALAEDESMMTELFNYRFTSGDLKGHNFGNLFLAAMDGISYDFYQAIRRTSKVLHIVGKVLPITLDPMILQARLENGLFVEGESIIPEEVIKNNTKIEKLTLKNREQIKPLEDTLRAIRRASIIVIGPGSLYTSIICNLLVPEIVKTIKQSGATVYYMGNLMSQNGETDYYTLRDHIKAIEDHARTHLIDVVVQHNGLVPKIVEKDYISHNQYPVVPIGIGEGYKVITENLIKVDKNNKIRHNTDLAAQCVFEHYLGKRRAL